MRKSEYTIRKPISIERLVQICKDLAGKTYSEAIAFGKECGITRHNIDALRQMLGYSDPAKFKHKTLEEREKIVQEYRDGGISMNALARKYGIHYNSVRCLIINRDVTITTSRNWTVRQEKFLLDGLKRKKPINQIADEMGKTRRSIIGKMKRMNLKINN